MLTVTAFVASPLAKSATAAVAVCARSYAAEATRVKKTENKPVSAYTASNLPASRETKERSKVGHEKYDANNYAGDQSGAPRRDGFQKLFF
jgi:hypothetical protein